MQGLIAILWKIELLLDEFTVLLYFDSYFKRSHIAQSCFISLLYTH